MAGEALEIIAPLGDLLDLVKNAEIIKRATVYSDLLSHLIVRSKLEDCGHKFSLTTESGGNGVWTLVATDDFDGKKYRISVAPVRS